MSRIGGALSLEGRPIDVDLLPLLARGLSGCEREQAWTAAEGRIGMSYRRFATTHEEEDGPNFRHERGRLLAAFDGRIDNHQDLIVGKGANRSDLDVLIAAYSGSRDPATLICGDFAFSIWDIREQTLLLSRDAFGVRSLYYRVKAGTLYWASTVDALLLLDEDAIGLDETYIAQFLSADADITRTPFRDILPVPPAHNLIVKNGNIKLARWWKPKLQCDWNATDDCVQSFSSVFESAVKARLRTNSKVAVLLSGGLDSSSIVCVADRTGSKTHQSSTVETITFAFAAASGSDERTFVREIEKHREKSGFHLVEDEMPILSLFPDPNFVSFPAPVFCFGGRIIQLVDALLSCKARTVLSGWGGDEVLLGGRRWPWVLGDQLEALQFSRFCSATREWALAIHTPIPRLLYQAVIRPRITASSVGLKPERISWLPRHLVELARRPRFNLFSGVGERRKRPHANAIARAVAPIAAGYACLPTTLATLDFRVPFLDRRLVELVLSLPNEQFQRPNEGRSLLRRAMIGIVPDSVRTRPSKGSPAAAFIRALQLQKSSIDILLKGGRAGSLGFIDVHKLEEHLNQLRHGVTEGIPEITRALSLEVWLQNLDSFRRNRRIIRETSQIRMERR